MASNKKRRIIPGEPVTIGDKDCMLRFNAAAIASLEEDLGCSISDILVNLRDMCAQGKLQIKFLLQLIAVGLQHEDDSWTWRTVGDQLEVEELLDMTVPLMNAIQKVFPAAEKKDDKDASKNGQLDLVPLIG